MTPEDLRAAMPKEEKRFAFFRGFPAIFISIGLVILLAGVIALLSALGGFRLISLAPRAAAAIGDIAIRISWVAGDRDGIWLILILLLLDALSSAIGTRWVRLRAWLMGVLPDFPGKSRLPPYGSTE